MLQISAQWSGFNGAAPSRARRRRRALSSAGCARGSFNMAAPSRARRRAHGAKIHQAMLASMGPRLHGRGNQYFNGSTGFTLFWLQYGRAREGAETVNTELVARDEPLTEIASGSLQRWRSHIADHSNSP